MPELLRRVADRMAEVQNHAQAGIVLIDRDHVALDLDAFVDDIPDARLVIDVYTRQASSPAAGPFSHAV